jgi:hypothetical protein
MPLFLLFGYHTLSAQVVNTEIKEPAYNNFQTAPDSLARKKIQQKADSLLADIKLRSCVTTFMNQTVSSYLFVLGCSTLTVQDVTVTSGGDLHLSAPDDITINGTFDVLLGGELNVNTTPPPPTYLFNYSYDASGNRINRTFVP